MIYQNNLDGKENFVGFYSGTQPDDLTTFNPEGNYNKEFGSSEFIDCRKRGYTKEFCLQTPIARNSPGTCMCPNGMLGNIEPGFKGKCVCNNSSFSANYT